MRILADVTPEQLQQLESVAENQGVSRAEIIRRAIDAYVTDTRQPVSSFFGLWSQSQTPTPLQLEDGVAFQERMRREW